MIWTLDYVCGLTVGFALGGAVFSLLYGRLVDRYRERWLKAMELVRFWRNIAGSP